MGLWPEISEHEAEQPKLWDETVPYERLMPFRYWFPWHFKIAAHARSVCDEERFILKKVPLPENHKWRDLLGEKRFVCWHAWGHGFPGFYLLGGKWGWSEDHLVPLTGNLMRAARWIKRRHDLKHFEGRSREGFHRHVALCFMAYLFRHRF